MLKAGKGLYRLGSVKGGGGEPYIFGGTSGLKSWKNITVDAQQRVSAWGDTLGLIADYTQSTDANKPLLSGAGNDENIFGYTNSEDLTATGWSAAGTVVLTPTTFRESTNNGGHTIANSETDFRTFFIAGLNYKFSARIQPAATRNIRLEVFSSPSTTVVHVIIDEAGSLVTSFGSPQNVTITSVGGGWYDVSFTKVMTLTAAGYLFIRMTDLSNNVSYLGDGVTEVGATRFQIQEASTDPTYLPTTDHPQYAGMNGRKWLVLNGEQGMASTSLLSSIITADEEVMYMPIKPFIASGLTQTLFRDTGGGNLFRINSTGIVGFYRNDGASRVAFSASALSPNVPVIIRARHHAGFLTVGVDSGSGYIDGTPVACSSVGGLSNSFRFGFGSTVTTDSFFGKLGGLFTDNVGTPDTEFEKRLRKDVFY